MFAGSLSRLRRWGGRFCVVAGGLTLCALLGLTALVVSFRQGEMSCFKMGQLAGKLAGDKTCVVVWAARVVRPVHPMAFFDGAGHTLAYDLEQPRTTATCIVSTVDHPRLRKPLLRGIFFRFGKRHARQPDRCNRFYAQMRFLSRRERAFGLANGMAWHFRPNPREGSRYGRRLTWLIRMIFFEELGWQVAAVREERGQPASLGSLTSVHPSEFLCLGIHGYMRHVVTHQGRPTEIPKLVGQAPSRCRGHAVHGAMSFFDPQGKGLEVFPAPVAKFLRTERRKGLPDVNFLP